MSSFVESGVISSLREEEFYMASQLPYVRNPYKTLLAFLL
jgi:hypothetical protein